MKFVTWIFFIALLIAFASAGVIPQEEEEYLPPLGGDEQPVEDAAALAEDGYRYKTVRKLRHRRDVSELVESAVLSDDGYHYRAPEAEKPLLKTSNEYLPPNEEATDVKEVSEVPQVSNEYLPPVEEVAEIKEEPVITEAPIVLDVPQPSEISNEYLPPVDDSIIIESPLESAEVKEAVPEPSEIPQLNNEYLPPVTEIKEVPEVEEGPIESAELADDGYHYKTVRRLKYRQRRDVSEIVAPASGYLYEAPAATEEAANVYLPPAEVKEVVPEPTEAPQVANKYLPPAEVKEAVPEPTEAPEVANEYLPPVAEIKEVPEIVEAPVKSAELADDGYRYKTVRRLKYRQRRDVSEIVAPASGYLYEAPAATEEAANVYLPPAEVKEVVPEPTEAPQVANKYLPPAEVKEAVPEPTEAPEVANEYLPPVAEIKEVPEIVEAPVESAELADDGYRYKTVRRLKYRQRRDVSEIVAPASGYLYEAPAANEKAANIYLPPAEVKEVIPEPTEAPQVANEYLPPAEVKEAVPEPTEAPEVANEYLPPVAEVKEVPEVVEAPVESAELADDGYRYKTVRRLKYRQRRDVSEIVAPASGYLYEAPAANEKAANIYLPPAEVKEVIPEPTEAPQVANEYLPPAEVKEAVPEPTEAPEVANEYLPPVAEVKEVPEVVEAPVESAELADDGYRYKTVRRLKYRQRRDVSEIIAQSSGYLYEAPAATEKAANVYLPPAEVKEAVPEPSEVPQVANEYLPPAEVKEAVPEPTEAPEVANEYLPPVAEVKEVPEVVEAPVESAELADDGYHYKTIRRLKYRHRRDVSEIIAPESALLGDDGYHYKVPEESAIVPKVSNEYLPPAELKEAPETINEIPIETEAPVATEVPVVTEVPVATEAPVITEAPKVSNEYLPPSEEVPELKEASEVPETAVLADDGYHYKANEGFRFRRDVSEVVAPSNGYVYEAPAPTDEVANLYLPPVEAKEAVEPTEAPQVSNEYLPPVEESKDDAEVVEAPLESAVLADDGYHYKTVRRLKYRQRRDVSEITAPRNAPNGYFYPSPVRQAVDVPVEDSAVLADDGYRYKTVRRIRYRHRRDVSEIVNAASNGYVYEAPAASEPVANEYLPPVEQVPEVKTVEAEPTEAAPAVSNEYLPPAEETRGDAEIVEAPEDSAVLADDGYRYKTVRRIRYRHRRDVSEIVNAASNGYVYEAPAASEPVANEYLPPVEQVPEIKTVEAEPTEAAPAVSNEYLPPAEETRGDAEIVEAPEDSAVLADDGYRYKTVRRIR